MNDYGGNRVPGASYFFTVRLCDGPGPLLTDHIAAFGQAIRMARAQRPFHVDAWVVLPDHIHTIWTLPPGDADCANRWHAVKTAFSKAVHKTSSRRQPLWQHHFQHHCIGDDTDYARLVDYVHGNPERHGLCQPTQDWPWSSLHRFRASGLILQT